MKSLLQRYVRLLLTESKRRFDFDAFASITSEIDARDYVEASGLKVLGQGLGRVVYDLDNGTVLKFSQQIDDDEQNASEVRVGRTCQGSPLAKVLKTSRDVTGNYVWIVVERVQPLSPAAIESELDAMDPSIGTLDDLKSVIWAGSHERWSAEDPVAFDRREVDHERLYKTNRWYRGMFDVVNKCDIDLDELRSDNFGLSDDGTLIFIDPGM